MKRLRTLTLVLLIAAAAGRLSGQAYRTFQDEFDEITARSGFRLGPLKVLPALRFSNIGYDTNILYRPKEEPAVSDAVGTLAAEIKACWLLGDSVILSFLENPEYNFYLHNADLRTLTNSYVPAVRFFLARRLAISGDYHVLSHVRRTTSEFGEPVENRQEGFNARVFFETPRGTAVGFSGSQDDFRYRNPGIPDPANDFARTLDRREGTGAFELYYRVFSRSYVFALASATDYAFLDPASSWRNAHDWRVSGGLRFPLLGQARGRLALGYKKFMPRAEERKRFSGLVADTDVSFRAGRVGLGLAYTRDNYFSYIDTAYYFVEDRFRCGLAFYILPYLRLEGSCQLAGWNYPEPQEVRFQGRPYLVENRRDKNRILAAGLAVRISGTTGLSVSYNFYRRTSNAPGYDIDRNFIGASLATDF
jgi:hypothetical protein